MLKSALFFAFVILAVLTGCMPRTQSQSFLPRTAQFGQVQPRLLVAPTHKP